MSKKLLNLLLIVATFAIYYLAISPLYKGTGGVWQPAQSIQSLSQLNKQYSETIAQAESLLSQADTLRAQYARITPEQREKMFVMVPDAIDKVRLLSEVTNIAASSGLPIADLSYMEGNVSGSRGMVGISFTVRTTYPKFKEFIDAFEKSMRLFSVQSVTFSAPIEGEITTYQVRLDTYYLK